MKKAIACVLVLCLAVMGTSAMAAGSAQLLEVEDGIQDFAYDAENGKIYVLGYEQLYSMNEDGSGFHAWQIEPYASDGDGAADNFRIHGAFWIDGNLCVLASSVIYAQDMSDVEITNFGLYTVALDPAAETAELERTLEIDSDELIEYDGDYVSVSIPDRMIATDGRLYGTSYDMSGQKLISFSLADGSVDIKRVDGDIHSILPCRDGRLLVVLNEYGEDGMVYRIQAWQTDENAVEDLFTLDLDSHIYSSLFCYDAASDCLYYDANGEILRVSGMDAENAEPVAAYPVGYPYRACVTADGDLLVAEYDRLWKISTDPSERPETRLVAQYNYSMYMDDARQAFQQKYPDVEVIFSESVGDVLQAMLTQSSAVDIYMFYVNSAEYSAVFNRGFMAELTESEILSDVAACVYPAIRDVIVKDAEVYALPVSLYNYAHYSYNADAFRRIGFAEEDAPQTWMEFFDLLRRLPESLPADSNITVFDPYSTQENVRMLIFDALLDDYMLYISRPENEFSFDTPLFRELMEAFEAIDFDALGVPEAIAWDEVQYGDEIQYNEANILFLNYGACDAYVSGGTTAQTLYLSVEEGAAPMIPFNLQVLFVNPFSENRELAISYLETVSETLDEITRIHMMPDENEPLLNEYYEEGLRYYDDQIASLETQLAEADDVDRQALEIQLEEIKSYRDEFEAYNRYTASAESIARYRREAEHMTIRTYTGIDGETSTEYYEQRSQYMEGAISLDEFIRNVDQKLQMIVLEGQ